MDRTAGADEGGGTKAWNPPLRGLLAFPFAFVFAFGYAGWALLLSIVAPRHFRRVGHQMPARWGRILLRIFGVRLEVVGGERLEEPGPRIVLFNHQSLLDLALLTAVWGPRTTVLYKQEFHSIPILGRAMRAFRLIPVDRANREAAGRSLREAAERIRERDAVLLVAPEGTRSRDGRLGPFKLGPFRLAVQTGAPLCPMVFEGVWAVLPMGRWVPRPGTVRIEVLEAVPTDGWAEADVAARAEAVRRLFLERLGPVSREPRCGSEG